MDIRSVTVAKKYAQAFLNVFQDALNMKDYERLCIFAHFLQKHRASLLFFSLPHIPLNAKLHAIDWGIDKFQLPQELKKLLTLLVESGRAELMYLVVQQVCGEYQRRNHIERFEISSSHALQQDQLQEIKNLLEHATKNTVLCSHRVDTNLIAGLRAQSDTKLWEYSIAKQLRILAKTAYR